MADKRTEPDLHGGRLRVPRSRGAFSGVVLIVLGAWGALIPLIGPYVDFGFTPDKAFHFDKGRFWLEILPGAAAVVGGLLLLLAANRLVTSFGGWVAVAAGAWFLVGPTLDPLLHLGQVGIPIHSSTIGSTLERLLLFTGIGSLILFFGTLAVGRLGVVSVRDVKSAQRREAEKEHEAAQEREAAKEHGNDSGYDDRTNSAAQANRSRTQSTHINGVGPTPSTSTGATATDTGRD